MLEQPSEENWKEWLTHPCTKFLRFSAEKNRLELMEMWASGAFSAAFDMEMAVKNAGATGACSVWELIKELDYNQIVIGAIDEEQVGPETTGSSSPGRTN